jgi:hypothetical protein
MSMTLFLLGHNGAGYVLPPHGHVAACCRSFFAKFYLESDSKLLPTLAPPIWSPEKSAEDERKGREREERKKKGRELQAARDREAAEKGEKRVQVSGEAARREPVCGGSGQNRELFFCGGSGQDLGLSGGDPPNPPYCRRGRPRLVAYAPPL